MTTTLSIIQIILAVLLLAGVLLQQSEAGLGAAFGGSGDAGFKHTRRGFEKWLFNATIIVAVLFVLSTFLALLL
jgi:preprotein translocase subunit SecG